MRTYPARCLFFLTAVGLLAGCYNLTFKEYKGGDGGGDVATAVIPGTGTGSGTGTGTGTGTGADTHTPTGTGTGETVAGTGSGTGAGTGWTGWGTVTATATITVLQGSGGSSGAGGSSQAGAGGAGGSATTGGAIASGGVPAAGGGTGTSAMTLAQACAKNCAIASALPTCSTTTDVCVQSCLTTLDNTTKVNPDLGRQYTIMMVCVATDPFFATSAGFTCANPDRALNKWSPVVNYPDSPCSQLICDWNCADVTPGNFDPWVNIQCSCSSVH
jgi:hypothetical protein